jgi:hypothetical protein
MGDVRGCAQCGALFTPRREHARFCSAECRVGWNREKLSDPAAEASALQWSVSAMCDAVERLPQVRPWDTERAFAVISEMVWWVTIVDATLVRYHPETYDALMAGQGAAGRQVLEGTLAGLRFVRNRMRSLSHDDFIRPQTAVAEPEPGVGPGVGPITAWTWKPVPQPVLAALLPRGQEWERTRYRAYQRYLASRTVGDTFGRATGFLRLTAGSVAPAADSGVPATL